MPQQIGSAAMVGKRKRGRPHKRWKDEVEYELNIIGMKKGQVMVKRPLGMEGNLIGRRVHSNEL
jgi:hypothetical protein